MSATEPPPLLAAIDEPADLRALPASRLRAVSEELREYLIASVAQSGGHLAAGLGAIELTVALHYVFDTPYDRLVWDVGHQCYPHKILTGRRERLHTIRQRAGLAGFPKRDESPYDHFGVGHSSTAISAALGMALGARLSGEPRKVCAIIGDGGMSAGQAFEALNHAGDERPDLMVVLNDNEMSISEPVGALSRTFARLLSGGVYSELRREGERVLSRLPMPLREFARRTEEQMKGMLVPGRFFEELGFDYFGPVDGHDVDELTRLMRRLRDMDGPRVLHIVTRKGKGYEQAERDPIAYHGVKAFNPAEGLPPSSPSPRPTYTEVFGRWLCDMAEQDERLWGITPAMREGSGLVEFARRFPERYLDTGIAEQHAVTVAAGLACAGQKPVVAIYSTFLQRGYDQLIHDVALQQLPVMFALDRAGIVGADGPTHNGSFDLSYLRCVPHIMIMTPADEAECRAMLSTAHAHDGPSAVRYPRGRGPGRAVPGDLAALPPGQGEIRRRGQAIAILAFGNVLAAAEQAGEALGATVANMRFVRPLDQALLAELAENHDLLVTVEENVVAGGAGAGVAEWLAADGRCVPVRHIGLPEAFTPHGERDALLSEYGLDAAGIEHRIRDWQSAGSRRPG